MTSHSNAAVILALDPSSTNVGFCVANGTEYQQSGVFSPKGKADHRVRQIAEWMAKALEDYQPNVLVLEEPAANNFHRNAKTDRLLSRVGGVLEGLALDRGVRNIVRVYPAQVHATRCSKKNLRYAAAVAGKQQVGPDEADALGVWLASLKSVLKRG